MDNRDYYAQARDLFRLMDAAAHKRPVDNVVAAMRDMPHPIQVRQIEHFHTADPAYGSGVAPGLGIA